MNIGYQQEDQGIIDYQLWSFPGAIQLRGPKVDFAGKDYFCAFGAAQTFGRFVQTPYVEALSRKIGIVGLNFGYSGAGPGFFLDQPELIDVANGGKFAILQILSGRSVSNTVVETAGDQGLLMRRTGQELESAVFAADAYGKLLRRLSKAELESLRSETRDNYTRLMIELMQRIKVPIVLLYFSVREPDYREGTNTLSEYLGDFPHFVNWNDITALMPHAHRFAKVVSRRGLPQQIVDAATGMPKLMWPADKFPNINDRHHNIYYPSPEMHEDVTAALTPVCTELLAAKAPDPSRDVVADIALRLPETHLLSLAHMAAATDPTGAVALFRLGARLFPEAPDRYGHPVFRKELLRFLLSRNEWDLARSEVAGSEGGTKDKWQERLFARALSKAGKPKEASTYWRRLLSHHLTDPEAMQALGIASLHKLEQKIQDTVFDLLEAGLGRDIRFIQVGANDGANLDPVSQRIFSGKWKGLLIEPVPATFDRLQANYAAVPGLKFHCGAVAATEGTMQFYLPANGSDRIASLSREHVANHEASEISALEVNVAPLSLIAPRYGLDEFDILVCDAEGTDDTVVRTIDLAGCGVLAVVYEHLHLSAQRRRALRRDLVAAGFTAIELHWNTVAMKSASLSPSLARLIEEMLRMYKKLFVAFANELTAERIASKPPAP